MPARPLYLGEGVRDVGTAPVRPQLPSDFEGDVPRLVRRFAELLGKETRFGYDAGTFRELIQRGAPRDGRPMRVGGKARELRDAVVYAVRNLERTPSAVLAVVNATLSEFDRLRRDADEIIAQCREIRADIPVVIGIALHEIEIRMLADEDARKAAFGLAVGGAPLPRDAPESLADPKQLWSTYAGRCPCPAEISVDAHRDNQRRAAWGTLRPAVVAHACPRGFAPFHESAEHVLGLIL